MKPITISKDAGGRHGSLSTNLVASTGWEGVKRYFQRLLFVFLLAALANPSETRALIINATFDSTITSDPNAAAIESTINSAIAVYEADFSDPITVNFTFKEVNTGLAGSFTQTVSVSYASFLNALNSHAKTVDDAIGLASLPGGPNNPVNGNSQIVLKTALARALGYSATPSVPDSTISLNVSIMNITSSNPNTNFYSLFSAVSHEMDEGLGFGGGLNGLTNGAAAPTGIAVQPMDLFRYDQNGNRSWTTALNAAAYFSLDGVNDLVRFNQLQGGDFEDWYSSPVTPPTQVYPAPEVQDAFGTPGSFPVLGVELRVLDAIGYSYSPGYQAGTVWVNYSFGGSQNGTYQNPYATLAQGISAVTSGGTVAINAISQPSHSPSAVTISKAMTITSVNGPTTIGQ